MGVATRGKDESAGSAAISRWRAALRWRRLVDEELAPLGLTLTEWLVLDGAVALIEEAEDAVSQSQIARRVEAASKRKL